VYPPEEVRAIGKWAAERGIWVLTDEIYEHLTYGSHTFASMPTLVPEIADRCVIVNGVAKTYAMTGWRVGWMIGPADVMKAAVNFQSHTTSNVNNVAQMAALAAVSGDLSAVAMMREAFERRGRTMHRLLSAIPGVTCLEPEGAFYCYPNVKGLLGRKLAGKVATTSLELADLILSESKVAIVPGEAFGTPGYARFSFALGDADLEEGIGRIARLVADS
jgi:aspartate/methionine/tyrosine aminotransferase